jgi:hypothetical protein
MTRPGEGLASRIARFFESNPEEELSYSDMTLKFGASYSALRYAVKEAVKRGQIESVHVIRRREKGAAR